MTPALLALALVDAPSPAGASSPHPAAAPSTSAPSATGASALAPLAPPPPAGALEPPPSPAAGEGSGNLLATPGTPPLVSALPAASGLAALAAVALLLSRRRPRSSRIVQVIETASLGPKRQLVVARMGDQVLLLGSSESGIALLASRPAEPAVEGAAAPVAAAPAPTEAGGPAPQARAPERSAPAGLPASVASLWERLRRHRAPEPAASFDALLQDTAEDQELRRKLARGLAARVA
jgi:flagellar biogenesis protein FliO